MRATRLDVRGVVVVSTTLLIAALVAILSAAAYAGVAAQLRRRAPTDPGDQWALHHFTVWWGATAANIFVVGLLYIAAAFDRITLFMQLTDSIVQRVLLAVSLWGLVTYLLYLITGRRYGRLVGLFYVAHAIFMVTVLLRSRPEGVYVGEWRTDLQYAVPPPPILDVVNFFAVVLAPVVASAVFLVIAIRLPKEGHREQRFRSIVVASALIFWWVVAVTAGQRGSQDLEWLQIVNRMLGLVAAGAILMAYSPPAWLRRRWQRADLPTTLPSAH